MSKRFLMAMDVGGGSGRCLLLDPEDGSTYTAKRDWTHPAAPGTAGLGYDLDLADIWRKLGEAAREVLEMAGAEPGAVLGLAATSMRNTTVVLDGTDGELVATPNQDARAVVEALTWAASDGKDVHEVSGHWPSPLFTGSRLIWMKSNAPELLKKAGKVLSLSDWVAFRLCGGIFAERSQAGETLLFDQGTGDWSYYLISSLGLRREMFPMVVDAGTVVGKLSGGAAAHLGLPAGVPVAAGGADTQCGLLGARAVAPGDICAIAGTTLPVQLVTDSLLLDDEGRLWSGQHVIPGLYYLESNGLTTGSVLDWLARIIYADYDDPVRVMYAEAARSEPGGAGVYSTFGACAFDARVTNIPVGNLTMSHMVTPGSVEGRRHVSRSLIEGVAYALRTNVEQLVAVAGSDVDEITVSAGMSRSPLWTQIVSDVTGKRVLVPSTSEVSALGAAVCAGVGAGVFGDLEQGAREVCSYVREHGPGEESARYQALFSGWSEACAMRGPTDTHVSGLVTMSLLERGAAAPQAGSPPFRPKMLVTASMDQLALAELEEIGDATYRNWRESMAVHVGGADLVSALAGCHVFVTEMDIVDFEAINKLPELRAVVSCRGNPVNVDIASATAYGISVINTPGRNADAVADLTVAFMIMLARKLAGASSFLKLDGGKAGDLARMGEAYGKYQGSELWRKTVGIIGMGSVGSAVARRVRSFGAEVVYYDPHRPAEEGALCNARKVSMDELLSLSDFVSLHAPTGGTTTNIMDGKAFAAMKPGAFFINTARASLVDQEALADALESGNLAGAALDVFSVEPPASDDRIVSRDDVIATPHIGGNTYEIAAHQGAIVAGQLRKLVAGETPDYILNPVVMKEFSWTGPRPQPPASELERLARKKKPRITS